MDLDSIPPLASLVHPADQGQGPNQSGEVSVPSRPLPIINATASGDNVQTNGTTTLTSAQRLYATSKSSRFASTSQTSVPIPEVSIGQRTSISACSIVDKDVATPDVSLSPTQASPPISVTANLEDSQPRYHPTRLRQSRQMTHPFLSLSSFSTPLSVAEGPTGQTLYNPAVQTSASGPNFNSKPRFKPQYQGQGPKVTRGASLGTSYPEGLNFRRKALPPTPADKEGTHGSTIPPTTSNNQHTKLYSGITEDNIFLLPAHGMVSLTEQRGIIRDEVPLPSLPPTQSGLHPPVASSSFSRSTDQVIFQPRPIKPLRGLSTSFQDQLRETSQPTSSLEEDQHQNVANRASKTPLFRRFSVGFIKAGKSEPDKDIRQDNRRSLDTSLDESFVLVNDVHL